MVMQKISIVISLLFLTSCAVVNKHRSQSKSQYVILKLDDLWYEDNLVHEGWTQVMDFLNEEDVIGTIGLIGSSLEEDNQEYFEWIKMRHDEGHEIWHHGFCHCRQTVGELEIREYRGKELDDQCESIAKTQRLAKEKLGITLHTFGAPYNSTDVHTITALNKVPEIKIWLYKETSFTTDKFLLNQIKEVNIEYPVHIPDFEKFKEGYLKYQSEPILILQGHPRSWTEDISRLEDFKKIVLFLKKQNVVFITPLEYLKINKEKN